MLRQQPESARAGAQHYKREEEPATSCAQAFLSSFSAIDNRLFGINVTSLSVHIYVTHRDAIGTVFSRPRHALCAPEKRQMHALWCRLLSFWCFPILTNARWGG